MLDSEARKAELLEEILRWQRLQGIQTLRAILPGILDTKEKKIVYEMTDGKNGTKEIQSKVNIASGTLSNWWSEWFAQGIMTKKGKKYIKIVSLKDIGINTLRSVAVDKQRDNELS